MFAEERPALGPLPLEPFRYYRFGDRTVHLDGCVEVEGAYYGAPPGWLGQRVQVQWNALHVRLIAPKTGQLLREHLRTRRGWYQIHDEDRPARTPLSTLALLARATSAGPHIGALCTQIQQHDGVPGIRRIHGVLALAKKHGAAGRRGRRQSGARSRRADLSLPPEVRRTPPAGAADLRQVDPLIRQLTLYRDLIDRKTGDPHESRRTRSRAPETPPLGHGGRPRNAAAPSPDRQVTPIDLVSTLVSDELLRRQDRLLERRHNRRAFAIPTARSTASTLISIRK